MPIRFLLLLLFIGFSNGLWAQTESDTLNLTKKEKKKFFKEKASPNKYIDTIILDDKNMLVGEIKSMDKSILVIKTRYSDSDFKVKWHKVKEIYTDRYFIISISEGKRITSTINTVKNDHSKVMLDSGVNTFEEDISDIIFLDPIGKNFFTRLTVMIDLGLTLTKANNLKQFSSNLSASYTSSKWNTKAYYNTVFSSQDGIDDLNRMDGLISYQYYLPSDWFLQATAEFLRNDEQKLDLRSTYKLGSGYFFKHTNDLYFAAGGGGAYTVEKYTESENNKSSSEIYVGLAFNKYDIGDLSLYSSVVYYKSLTESGRQRLDFNFDLKYDLPFDFYIRTNLAYNYDNQVVEGATNSDYVFQTSVGWEHK